MQFVYIGFWDSIIDWIVDAILSPIVKLIGNLLSKVLSFLFNSILGPILKSVAVPIFNLLLDILKTTLSGIFYSILAELLKLVDYMEKAFRIIIGLDPVKVQLDGATTLTKAMAYTVGTAQGGSTSNGYLSLPITEAFFSFKSINTAYWLLNFIGLSLVVVFAAIGVARSAFDIDFEGKRPVSRVLSSLFRAVTNLFTVQLVLLFIIKLSSAVLKGIDLAMQTVNGGSKTSLGRMVFTMASLEACTRSGYNLSDNNSLASITDDIRRSYYYTSCPSGQSFNIYDFTNVSDVKLNFDLAKMDFLIGYILAVFLLIIMGSCLIVFVQRLMDMLVLYLASPFFVSMIALDDGERFKRWRELFIGKCFSGFGMVLCMQLYVMLCPLIMDSKLKMSLNSLEFDYLCKMIFLVGGAWAILKSGNMITSLLSDSAGSTEAQTASVAAGVGFSLAKKATAMAASGALSVGKGALGAMFSSGKDKADGGSGSGKDDFEFNGEGGSGGGGDGGDSSDNKFSGDGAGGSDGKLDGVSGAGGSGGEGGSGGSGGEGGSGISSGSGISGGSGGEGGSGGSGGSGESGGPEGAGSFSGSGEAGSGKLDGVSGSGGEGGSGGAGGSGKDGASGGSGGEGDAKKEDKPFFKEEEKLTKKTKSSWLGGMFKSYEYRDKNNKVVSTGHKFSLGRIFSFESGAKGKEFKLFGMGMRFKDGKMTKANFLFGSVSRKMGTDGKMHVSKTSVMGCKVRADLKTGEKKLTDIGAIGLHMKMDKNGHRKLTDLGPIGLHMQMGKDGKTHIKDFGLIGLHRKRDKHGEFHTRSVLGGIYKGYGGDDDDQNKDNNKGNKK